MLTNSKAKNEKIVLGLLSYTYTAGNPDTEEQNAYLKTIRNNQMMDILLYKQDKDDNYIGIMVIEKIYNNETASTPDSILIHRVGITPSFRKEGYGYEMFCELKTMFPKSTIIASVSTMDLIANWSTKYLEKN